MRCLIIGGDGMLGHQLLRCWAHRHEVRVTLRDNLAAYREYELFDEDNSFSEVDVRDTDRVRSVLAGWRPQVIVNAAGIIKQRPASNDALASLEVNAVFPHRLRLMCLAIGTRMIHLSTDCVFSGTRGPYSEQDACDVSDAYGLTKYLGEVAEAPALTLRTSILGLELKNKHGLVEWFLAQEGRIQGYTRAIYTGLTTAELCRVIEMVIMHQPGLSGVWQVASEPISKHQLLVELARHLGRRDVEIVPDQKFCCNRSLSGAAFSERTGYQAPSWTEMLSELAREIRVRPHSCSAA